MNAAPRLNPRSRTVGYDGVRSQGKPRTEEERKARHKKLFGTTELPPRGTGLKRGGRGVSW